MMEELRSGPQIYRDSGLISWLEYFIDLTNKKNVNKGDCESSSLTLCWYLTITNKKVYVAQIGSTHTVVYFDKKYWIDIGVGIVWNHNFSHHYKLSNYNLDWFEEYWGLEGSICLEDSFTFIEVKQVAKFKIHGDNQNDLGVL